MRTEKLTEAKIEQFQIPKEDRYEVWDTQLKGLKIRIGKSGKKVWYYWGRVRREGGSQAFQISLGDAEVMSVIDAREEAGRMIKLAKQGIHPADDKKDAIKKNQKAKQKMQRQEEMTFRVIAKEYIEQYAKKEKKTWRDDELMLDKDWIPNFRNKPIGEITKADVVKLLDKIERRAQSRAGKGFYAANNNLALIRKLFNWAIDERGYIEHSPITRNMSRGKKRTERDVGSRKRKYTDEELKAFWSGVEGLTTLNKPAPNKTAVFKMLLLTGQRAAVIGGLRWDEVDLEEDIITIAADEDGRSKGGKEHIIPLSTSAKEILENLDRPRGAKYVFSSGSRGDVELTLGNKLKKEIIDASKIEAYLHQHLRGIVVTRMRSPLKINPLVIDLVQERRDKSVQGMHYDSNDFLDEKRAALRAWDEYLMGIVSDADQTNVHELPKREAV